MRGINDDEVDGLRAADARPSVARALHRADAGRRDARRSTWEHVVPSDEVLARIARRSAPLERRRAARRAGNGPAAYHRLAGARGHDRRDHADDAHVLRVAAIACGSPPTAGCAPACSAITRSICARRCAPAMPLEPFFRRRARREAEGARAAADDASADCARCRRSAADQRSTSRARSRFSTLTS